MFWDSERDDNKVELWQDQLATIHTLPQLFKPEDSLIPDEVPIEVHPIVLAELEMKHVYRPEIHILSLVNRAVVNAHTAQEIALILTR
jgi:hypothetical protein